MMNHQEIMKVPHIYPSNNRVSKYVNQDKTEMRREIDKSTITIVKCSWETVLQSPTVMLGNTFLSESMRPGKT